MSRKTLPRTRLTGAHGFTLVELLIVVALIGILASITAPFLVAAKTAANEASAIGSTRAINSAQATYSSSCGIGFYAPSVLQLVNGEYASADAALPIKSGFSHSLGIGMNGVVSAIPDCNGDPMFSDYYWASSPLGPTTGRRGFATNQIGTIWQDLAGIAPVEPFVEAGTIGPIR
jgi:prepilin-type N-terminal cleavage/methylation domain-containing protein